MSAAKTDLRTRVFARLELEPDGCLLWTGNLTNGGYGTISLPRPAYPALVHRLMYEWFVGPIPDGMQIDHLCRVRRCGSPAHLEVVTARENTLRGNTLPAANLAKTHCPAGHAYDPGNTAYKADGARRCLSCHAAWNREYGRRRRHGV